MKWLLGIAFTLCIVPAIAVPQEPSKQPPVIMEPDRFDQWGDLRPNDENARLNKIAIQAKEWHLSIIHLVIHAGEIACAGEARARGMRARNYLMRRGIPPERIVWTDAGWSKEVKVQVWIWPPELGKPKIDPGINIKRSAVKLEKNCRVKYRGPIASGN